MDSWHFTKACIGFMNGTDSYIQIKMDIRGYHSSSSWDRKEQSYWLRGSAAVGISYQRLIDQNINVLRLIAVCVWELGTRCLISRMLPIRISILKQNLSSCKFLLVLWRNLTRSSTLCPSFLIGQSYFNSSSDSSSCTLFPLHHPTKSLLELKT